MSLIFYFAIDWSFLLPTTFGSFNGRLLTVRVGKDDSVLCGEKIYNNIKIYDFQFISGRNDKEALLFQHIHIWLIHNLENTS